MVGFGTVMSPRANCMITGRVMNGAYAAGFPDCCAHSVLSSTFWIAEAPGTVSTTGGRFRSGMFSLNEVKRRVRHRVVERRRPRDQRDADERPEPARRAISMIEPPATFGTPARMSGSSPSSWTP